MIAIGWQQAPAPGVDLAFLGMPGCELHVDPVAFAPLAGQDQHAEWAIPIPDDATFVGMHFCGQALVLDRRRATGWAPSSPMQPRA